MMLVGSLFFLPAHIFAQNDGTQVAVKQTEAYVPIGMKEDLKGQLNGLIELADEVLYNKDFNEQRAGSKNRAYALIDLRTDFLNDIIGFAKAELIDPRNDPESATNVIVGLRPVASKDSEVDFYDAMNLGLESLSKCFIPTDFRSYRSDLYISTYSSIRDCFREKLTGLISVESKLRLSLNEAKQAAINGEAPHNPFQIISPTA